MLRDLFVNSTILISALFVGSQLFKNIPMILAYSIKEKILLGFLNGTLAIILMLFSVNVPPSTILDFRHIPIMTSALYGGPIPSLITGLIIFLFRISFFGISIPGTIAAVSLFIISIVCGLISKLKYSEIKKFNLMNTSTISIMTITLIIVFQNKANTGYLLLGFCVSSIILGYMTFYLSEHIRKTMLLFKKLSEESKTDFLTGLNNVRQFDSLINNAIENCKNKNERLSLLVIDIDHFKKINDTYGHPAGDAVLKELGMVLSNNCRSFDEVSRVGGEEFSAILPDCPKNQALEIAEKLRNVVEKHTFTLPDGRKVNITVSMGLSSYPDTTNNVDIIIKEADCALYKAKQSGRNRVCY